MKTDLQEYFRQNLVLDRYGQWWHESERFTNAKLSDLFNRSIYYDQESGQFKLKIAAQIAEFTYEDTVFFVLRIIADSSPWNLEISDGSLELFKPKYLWLGSEKQIYVELQNGFRARFSKAAHQNLLEYALDDTHFQIDTRPVELVKI